MKTFIISIRKKDGSFRYGHTTAVDSLDAYAAVRPFLDEGDKLTESLEIHPDELSLYPEAVKTEFSASPD